MTFAAFIASLIPHNAIAQTELAYQRRSSRAPHRWWHRLSCGLLFAGLTTSTFLFLLAGVWTTASNDFGILRGQLKVITQIVGGGVIIYHFALMLRTISVATNSLIRERQNNTLATLAANNKDAREVVRGKWWATVQYMWQEYTLLGVMRAAMAVWYSVYSDSAKFNPILLHPTVYGDTEMLIPMPFQILIGSIAVFILTMANLPFTAACGMLAARRAQKMRTAVAWAMGIRVIAVAITLFCSISLGFLIFLPIAYIFRGPPGLYLDFFANLIGHIASNGLTLGIEMGSMTYNLAEHVPQAYLPIYAFIVTVVCIMLYGVLSRSLLYMAEQNLVNEKPEAMVVKQEQAIG